MSDASPTTPQQFAAAWRDAANTAEAEAALAGMARAIQADVLGRARTKLSQAAVSATDNPEPLMMAWAGLDRDERAAILASGEAPRELPKPITATEAAKLPPPTRLLSASGRAGAVLTLGEVCLLAGAGNVGKSPLAGEIALAVADPDAPAQRLAGGLFDVHESGPVLWLTWEEQPGWIGQRLRDLAGATKPKRHGAPDRVHILDMRDSWPLFGPGDRHGAAGLYSARPERLDGWQAMEAAGGEPRLIVIDPVLAAYVGESNNPAPVREFLSALAAYAREREAGVLALAHSTKAARSADSDPFDPGQIAGSAAWYDGVRGALVLDYEDDPEAGPQRRLAVAKANMGPARILRAAIPRRKENNQIIGFTGDPADPWHEWQRPSPKTKGRKGKTAGGAASTDGSGLD